MKVVYTPEAEAHLLDLYRYIAEQQPSRQPSALPLRSLMCATASLISQIAARRDLKSAKA